VPATQQKGILKEKYSGTIINEINTLDKNLILTEPASIAYPLKEFPSRCIFHHNS